MASTQDFVDFILSQLSEAGDVSARKMMGEYVLYYKGKVFGGIYDNRFLVKNIKSAKKLLPSAEEQLPYKGAKLMLAPDNLDDKKLLANLLKAMYGELPEPKPKK